MISTLLDLIPDDLKSRARDAVVDVLTNQAEEHLGHDAARKLRGLRSDASFLKAFDEGLQRALQRFVVKYEEQDEDLTAAVAEDPTIFENKEVQDVLLTMLKRPGTYLVDEREQIVQTFASVFPTRKNRERVDRALTYLLRCLAEELWHLPELQPVYSLHFQKASYETLRQQLDLQKAQLMALTELNAGLRDALLELADAIAFQKLLPQPRVAAVHGLSKVLHNLPQPDYEEFVGRENELAELHRLLSPEVRHFLVTIDGIGGIGKSALALKAAHHYLREYDHIPPPERFEAIVWATAKRTVLTAEGIQTRRQFLRNLDDLYTAIAIACEREDITRARPEDQDQIVRHVLTQKRTLLIVDNLETIDDEQLLQFLRELPSPTKAIITTRHRIDTAYPIRLTGMTWMDASRLITQESDRKRINLTTDEARRLYERTGGVPLAIVWSVGLVGRGRGIEAVLARLGEPNNDIVLYCFEGSLEWINQKPALQVLLALSVFAAGATRDAIGQVADLAIMDRDEGLADLEQLSLVNKQSNRYSLLPLTRSMARTTLLLAGGADQLYHRLFEYSRTMLARLTPNSSLMSSEARLIAAERDNILELIDFFRGAEPDRALDLVALFAEFLYYSGFWTELLPLCNYALSSSQDRPVLQIQILACLGRMETHQGNFIVAEDHLEQAISISGRICSQERLVSALTSLAIVYETQGRIDEAHALLLRSEAISRDHGFLHQYALTQNVLAAMDLAREDYTEARRRLEEALRVLTMTDQGASRGVAPAYRLLARVELMSNNREKALEYLLKSLEVSEATGYVLDLGYSHYRLGMFYRLSENYEMALHHLSSALDLAQRLGMERLVERIERELDDIREKVFHGLSS